MSTESDLADIMVRDEGVRSDHAAFIAARMLERLDWPTGGGPAFVIDRHSRQPQTNLTPADLINEMRSTFRFAFGGGPVPPKQAPASGFAPDTMTARAIAERDARQATAKSEADAVNPFTPATRNLTRQAVMERDDPARAARLRNEAGA